MRVVLVLLVFLTACRSSSNPAPAMPARPFGVGYQTYEQPYYGVSINYPGEWTVQELNDREGELVLLRPNGTKSEVSLDAVTIPLGRNYTPMLYIEELVPSISNRYPNRKLLAAEPVTLASVDAGKLEFTVDSVGRPIHALAYIFVSDTAVFQLWLIATPDEFLEDERIVTEMANTFRLK